MAIDHHRGDPPRKGRGATFDPPNRFAPSISEAIDDGWWREEVPTRRATTLREEPARSALAWNTSPDLPFDRSINPYRGCEHGCIYCSGITQQALTPEIRLLTSNADGTQLPTARSEPS